MESIRVSGGTALSATDAEILQSVQDLGREGLCVEASSALPVACLPRLVAEAGRATSGPIVCILTAAGIKWPEAMAAGGPAYTLVDPAPEAVERYLAIVGLDGSA